MNDTTYFYGFFNVFSKKRHLGYAPETSDRCSAKTLSSIPRFKPERLENIDIYSLDAIAPHILRNGVFFILKYGKNPVFTDRYNANVKNITKVESSHQYRRFFR